jgi:hypothetical protein
LLALALLAGLGACAEMAQQRRAYEAARTVRGASLAQVVAATRRVLQAEGFTVTVPKDDRGGLSAWRTASFLKDGPGMLGPTPMHVEAPALESIRVGFQALPDGVELIADGLGESQPRDEARLQDSEYATGVDPLVALVAQVRAALKSPG